ncbi:MAG: hypothetical protein N3B01_09880 [Verrucomicrobiae bacterium]|nr:hypothetical protein [Verrucomicrobiae bacterium]
MIERDPDFYAAVMRRLPSPYAPPPYLTIFPTYRCNIHCNVCYVPRRDPAMDMCWRKSPPFWTGGSTRMCSSRVASRR